MLLPYEPVRVEAGVDWICVDLQDEVVGQLHVVPLLDREHKQAAVFVHTAKQDLRERLK